MSHILIWSLFTATATAYARPFTVRCWQALLPPIDNVHAIERRLRQIDANPNADRRLPWWLGRPSWEVRKLAPNVFKELAAESEIYGSN